MADAPPENGPQPIGDTPPASGPQPIGDTPPVNGPQPIGNTPPANGPQPVAASAPDAPSSGTPSADAPDASTSAASGAPAPSGSTGPGGLTINQSNGATNVTTPDGTTVSATNTGPDTYGAQLPDGRFVTGNADGTTTITAQDGGTTNYNAAGQPTGSAPPSLESGGGVDAPPLHHAVRTATDDGGYTVSHPDGTVDVHHAGGSAIHVEADGSTWRPIP